MTIKGPITYEGICLTCVDRPNQYPSPLDWRGKLGGESPTAIGNPKAQLLDDRRME